MYVLGNFIAAIAVILGYIISVLTWIIIIRALLSWVNPDPYNMIVQILHRVTEPILAPIRRMIPMHNIGIDVSPIIAILFLWFVKLFIVRTMIELAVRLR
ncbi:MAG: YggT family protein [Candidatus Omnitrophica bacterium]|nr:YggT family protein [Candidatus Omnitrophota bacterium]